MYQTRDRFEQRQEEYRGSPYQQQFGRQRDISPQRNTYDRTRDPRGNPHSQVFDPSFDPTLPLPHYHKFPQPQYQRNNEGYDVDRYQEKKFDYRYDDRYHRQPGDRRQQPEPYDHHAPQQQQHFFHYGDERELPHGRYDENKGYLVMVRFRPQDLAEVINAVQKNVSTLTSHEGYCIGFSEPNTPDQLMRVLMASHQGATQKPWFDHHDSRQSMHAVACFWFKEYTQARSWFQSGIIRFKQPEFPNSNRFEVIAVPLTYGRNRDPIPFTPDQQEITLLWTEYPHIFERYHNDFLDNYSRHENRIMRKYGGNPYVSMCKCDSGDLPSLNKFGSPGYARFHVDAPRNARSWGNTFVTPGTYITISTFPTMHAVEMFWHDEEFRAVRYHNLARCSEPVVVAITLKKVRGTSRY